MAERDVHRIWCFLAARSVAYADRAEAKLRERAESLVDHPRIGRPVRGEHERELSVPDFQYRIVYRIADDQIRILRIWSTREQGERP